jgi:hypothetical protein
MAKFSLTKVNSRHPGGRTCVGSRIGFSVEEDGLKGTTCRSSGEASEEGESNVAIEGVFYFDSCSSSI